VDHDLETPATAALAVAVAHRARFRLLIKFILSPLLLRYKKKP
jgi:hypothetical protein